MQVTLIEVEHYLDQAVAQPFHSSQAGAVLEKMQDEYLVPSLLESLLEDPDQLAAVAARSYRQQNGFEKLVLSSPSHRGYRLRLHIWNPKGANPTQEDDHNHAWPFASVVVNGALRHTFSIESPDGESRHKHTFTYRHLNDSSGPFKDGYEAEYIGPAGLKPVHEADLVAGSRYTLQPEVIHRITNFTNTPSATLFLNGPFRRAESSVYLHKPLEGRDRLDVVHYQPEQLAHVIRQHLISLHIP